MGIQETAQDVLGLVQALAEGKELEFRSKGGTRWATYGPADGALLFYLDMFDYRIKRDLREELFDLMRKYGREMYYAGQANGQDLAGAEASRRESAKADGEKIELLVDLMLGEKK